MNVEVRSPRSLDDALAALAESPERWTVLAGGTDVMVYLEARTLKPYAVLDIWKLSALRFIRDEGDRLAIGALATYTDLLRSPLVAEHAPDLRAASAEIGAVAIQNRGTLGGNVVNASPAGDTLPALLAADAEVELQSLAGGERRVPLSEFFVAYRKTARRPDELLTAIRVPKLRPGERALFRKVGTRRAQAIAKMVLGVRVMLEDGRLSRPRIGVGCAGPMPLRATATEALLEGQRVSPELIERARTTLASEVKPIDDVRSTAAYRRRVAGNVLCTFLAEV